MLHFSKNLFIVILSLIFFHGKYIYASEAEELDGIDVLTQLKSKVPNCVLADFLRFKNESNILINDLTKYCSPSESVKQYRILCHMLSYELEKACKLPKNRRKRPSEAVYVIQDSPEKICTISNLQTTNQWIWNKITNNGQYKIDVNAEDLCTKVTKDTDTLRLARFFYKIAPRVRNADAMKKEKDEVSLNSNKDNSKEPTLGTKTAKEKSHQPSEPIKKPIDNANDGTEKDNQNSDGKINKDDKTGEDKTSKTNQIDGESTEKVSKIGDGETKKTIQGDINNGGVEDSKQTLNSSTNVTNERTQLRKNATSELSPDEGEKQQRVLDLNKSNNKVSDNKKDQANANDDDNNMDDDDDENVKENEQGPQIPKPNLLTKKDEETGGNKSISSQTYKTKETGETIVNKTSNLTDKSAEKVSSNENNQSGKKNKETDNEDDTKNNNEDNAKKNNEDNTKKNNEDNTKKNNGQDDDEGETDPDEESQKQLKQQQEESDKDDRKSAVDGKGKPGADDRVNGLKIRKPTDADKKGLEKNPDDSAKISNYESSKTRNKVATTRKYSDDDGWSGSFVTYFLLFTVLAVVGYIVLHNKNKLMAYIVEGRRTGISRTGSRPSHRGYEKLKNINDVIPIDDTNPISDKETIVLNT